MPSAWFHHTKQERYRIRITGGFDMQICGGFRANTHYALLKRSNGQLPGQGLKRIGNKRKIQTLQGGNKPPHPAGNTRKKPAQAGKACAGWGVTSVQVLRSERSS